VNPLDELLHTLDVLGKAIRAKDSDKAFEAVTVLLMEFAGFFGPTSSFFTKTLPILEQLKEHIENERFEEADILTTAFLARIREVKAEMG
jgi:hypothetical protein